MFERFSQLAEQAATNASRRELPESTGGIVVRDAKSPRNRQGRSELRMLLKKTSLTFALLSPSTGRRAVQYHTMWRDSVVESAKPSRFALEVIHV
jgi:hypothetical protein